jgi:excisionase family DNA binding protein
MPPMTPSHVAEKLGVNPRTVRRWIAAGRLEAFEIPRGRWGKSEYRITQEALDKFLSEQPGEGRE